VPRAQRRLDPVDERLVAQPSLREALTQFGEHHFALSVGRAQGLLTPRVACQAGHA
jgi:hypothetical protein